MSLLGPLAEPAPTDASPVTPSSSENRIAASVENWKRRLLDVSKRNRALNFRVNKVSTVAILDEQPAEVFRQLYVRGKPMRFVAAPEENGVTQMAEPRAAGGQVDLSSDTAVDLLEQEDQSLGVDFAPYDPLSLGEQHMDDMLQTSATPEALDKSLRRLDEQARSAIEEQGVNTLFLALGMLHYTESADSAQVYRAPLVLLPVGLSRRSARSGYQIDVTDDDPIVNPALAEYLRPMGVTLPELPDLAAVPEDYDLQTLFSTTAERIAEKKGWAVKTDIYLGLFSFQKFVMYKDLEANAASMGDHRLIQQLVTRSGDQIAGLPAEIRGMELDREYPPETTFQVVDADGSQLRAIAASARDYDLVIEGPPGTGKSQTITNLIAQALAADKSVLFVAEKMAALSVVHDRLVRAGLGEFCLEMHSTKANKRSVMKELASALDASFQGVAAPTVSTTHLPQVRTTLTEYAQAVHSPSGTLKISPYRAYGELGRVIAAPRLFLAAPIDTVTREQLDQAVRDLQDLAATASEIGNPAEHPWRDSARTFHTEDDLEQVRRAAQTLLTQTADVQRRAEGVAATYQLPPIRTFAEMATAVEVAAVLRRSPGVPLAVLKSDAWNAPPTEATALVARGCEFAALKQGVEGNFTAEVLKQEHAGDIAYVEQKSQGIFSFLAFLDGRYRSIKRRWMSYRLPSFEGSLIDQASEMKQVDRLRAERAVLAGAEAKGRELFGSLWQGEASSWNVLDNYIRWVVEFRSVCIRHGLEGRTVELAAGAAPDVSDIDELRQSSATAQESLKRVQALLAWPEGYLGDAPLSEIGGRATSLAENVVRGPQWAAFEAARQTVAQGIAREALPAAMEGQIIFRDLAPTFLRAFYMKWLSGVVQEREPLAKFHTLTHEQRVAEFRALDERVLLENRAALVGQLRDRVQHKLQRPEAAAGLPYLRSQMARQRGLAPLRRTIQQAEPAIRAIKPCFLMSPLTVAQYLEGSTPSFDLVIFDEASQLPAEDAVGAVIRGKRLVVVGDPKQLPPTNFFSVSVGQTDVPLAEDGTPLYEDAESILEEFMGAGVPMSRLKWHYRSAHESLINFSNVSFYDADLYTFPSVESGADGGLQFEYVADGVYEGKGLNPKEAKRVADAVVRFAREQLERQERGETPLSLGVGTFNMRQQLGIQDELEKRRREDPSIEPFFSRGLAEPFFVKNLENIQGDERDVIFISVTYAKGPDGKLRYNFGPLNGQNGWRRLNVLTTRARQQMRVFSSMRGDEINTAATSSEGARLLREFLNYAEHGRLESTSASLAADTDSPFERDVLTELTRRGVTVVPQVGVAGYRIDLGILDDAAPGRFLCGIECDGAAYHSSDTARDRDRLRQQVLEARGWTIYRLWSTDWFKDRQGQIERLLRLIEEARVRATEEAAAERELRVRAAEEAAQSAAEAAERTAREVAELRSSGFADTAYVRPSAAAYTLAPGEGQYAGSDLLMAPLGQRVQAVTSVVETESPLHTTDLLLRVAGMWGVRTGSRIQACILEACRAAENGGLIRKRGDFYWRATDEQCAPRSRTGTKIPGDRIAPEEYGEAIRAVLGSGHSFTRAQLTTEVRGVFGFSRTGAVLDEAIGTTIDAMLRNGTLGEASTGIRLRSSATADPASDFPNGAEAAQLSGPRPPH